MCLLICAFAVLFTVTTVFVSLGRKWKLSGRDKKVRENPLNIENFFLKMSPMSLADESTPTMLHRQTLALLLRYL